MEPVENADGEQLRLLDVAEVRDYVGKLYRAGELPPPATYGMCQECERDNVALWIYGDFVLCVRCVARRRRARADGA